MSRIDIGPLLASLKSGGSGSLIPQSNGLQNVLALIAQQQQSRRREPDLIGPALIQAGQQFSDNQFKGALVREQQDYQSAENEANRIERHNEAVLQQQSAERMATERAATQKEIASGQNELGWFNAQNNYELARERITQDKNLADEDRKLKLEQLDQRWEELNQNANNANRNHILAVRRVEQGDESLAQQAEKLKQDDKQFNERIDLETTRMFGDWANVDRELGIKEKSVDQQDRHLKIVEEGQALENKIKKLTLRTQETLNEKYTPEQQAKDKAELMQLNLRKGQLDLRAGEAQAKTLEDRIAPLDQKLQAAIETGDVSGLNQEEVRTVSPLIEIKQRLEETRNLKKQSVITRAESVLQDAAEGKKVGPMALMVAGQTIKENGGTLNPTLNGIYESGKNEANKQILADASKYTGKEFANNFNGIKDQADFTTRLSSLELRNQIDNIEASGLTKEEKSALENKLFEKAINNISTMFEGDYENSLNSKLLDEVNKIKTRYGQKPFKVNIRRHVNPGGIGSDNLHQVTGYTVE